MLNLTWSFTALFSSWISVFIPARIWRMTECNVFTLSTIAGGYPIRGPDRAGGGYPIPGLAGWGYPIPGLDRVGTLSCWQGGTPSQVWMRISHPKSRWGHPIPVLDGGTPSLHPIQDWMGYPHPLLDGLPLPSMTGWGATIPPAHFGQNSKASTCCAAGGVPLAFMQEDFIVVFILETHYFLAFAMNGPEDYNNQHHIKSVAWIAVNYIIITRRFVIFLILDWNVWLLSWTLVSPWK